MPNALLHRSSRILLSAVMLATTGVSPGVTHAHTGGASPHTHATNSQQPVHSHFGHTYHHHRAHHQAAARHERPHDQIALVEVGGWHTHMSLFGWPLTIPTNDGQDADTTNKVAALKAQITAAPADLQAAANSAFSFLTPTALATVTSWLTVDDSPSVDRPVHAYRSLLCDTARRERSGVLLA